MLTDDDVQRLNDQACTNNFGRQGEWDELNEDGKAWARELATLAHERGCRDTVAGAASAAGRLEKLLPDLPAGKLYSEAAADEIERLRAALQSEQGSHDMTKVAFETFVETPPAGRRRLSQTDPFWALDSVREEQRRLRDYSPADSLLSCSVSSLRDAVEYLLLRCPEAVATRDRRLEELAKADGAP